MDGDTPHSERQRIFREYRSGDVQFLSVCGLCKEGFNDPPTACVAVFRPVSKAASSLAEQMKGRGSRPLPDTIEGLATADERKQAIAASGKVDCLIVDLVGITGLADCASTVQIYAEGFADAVVARAEEIAVAGGVPDPMECLEQAQREADDEAEHKRQKIAAEIARRKEAAERARLDPRARYETHEFGRNGRPHEQIPGMASEGQVKYLHFLGMELVNWLPTKGQAGRMLDQFLNQGKTPDEVAYLNGIAENEWQPALATAKQVFALGKRGINAANFTPKQASAAFDRLNGKGAQQPPHDASLAQKFADEIGAAETHGGLTDVADHIVAAKKAGTLGDKDYRWLVEIGRTKRASVF
jgi:hypothetical protein